VRDAAAGGTTTVAASELTASRYARGLSAPGVAMVVQDGSRTLASTVPARERLLPALRRNLTVDGEDYRAVSQTFIGFGRTHVTVTVLSALSAAATGLGSSCAVAAVLIVAFLVLAFGLSMLASRALHGRLRGFLEAARPARARRARPPGVISVARRGRLFSEDDLEVLQ
jgi:hypothetical protein